MHNQLLKDVNESKNTCSLSYLASLTFPIQLLGFKRKLRLTMTRRCKYLPLFLMMCVFSRQFFDRRMGQEIDGDVLGE